MRIPGEGNVDVGDRVVVKDENLCVDGKDLSLECDVIICRKES